VGGVNRVLKDLLGRGTPFVPYHSGFIILATELHIDGPGKEGPLRSLWASVECRVLVEDCEGSNSYY